MNTPVEQLAQHQHNRATERITIINAYRASGLTAKAFCTQNADAPSHQTLYRWLALYEQGGYTALAPSYGKTRGRSSIDKQTLNAVLQLYLTQNKLQLRYCVALVEQARGAPISYYAVRRAVQQLPVSVVDKYRKGEKYFNDHHVVHAHRDYRTLRVMQWICIDHHLLDIIVRNDAGTKMRRVWLTCAQDLRSRYIVAWRIVDQPNEITIAECLYDIATKHGGAEHYYIDNGKDFTSTLLTGSEKKRYKHKLTKLCYTHSERRNEITGIYASLGSRVVFATPYHPESKPIERFFKEVNNKFSRLFPSYAGSNTADRPERVKELWKQHKHNIAQLPTIEAVERTFHAWLEAWHSTHQHSGQGMDGRTPHHVFTHEAHIEKKQIPHNVLPLIFSRVERRRVYQSSVTWGGVPYYADSLIRYSGSYVQCLRPIFDVSVLYIRDMSGRIVAIARANAMIQRGTSERDFSMLKRAKKAQAQQLMPYAATGTYGATLMHETHAHTPTQKNNTPPTRRKKTLTLLEGY